MQHPTRTFFVAFVLFSLALCIIVGLNLTSSRLQIEAQSDPAVSISHSTQGLIFHLFDDDFLLPESSLTRLETGGWQLVQAGQLLIPARFQAAFSAAALMIRSLPEWILSWGVRFP